MASRKRCAAVALGLIMIPAFWDHAQPRPGYADSASASTPAALPADRDLAAAPGIQDWVRILALSESGDPVRSAPTLFVPSDGAMRALPDGMARGLLEDRALRRAFLARSAADLRIDPKTLAGRRIQLATLDGRRLVIDASGGEIHVGDAEAVEIRTLADGRLLFILDDRITQGSIPPD